jgi:hypothetical protein
VAGAREATALPARLNQVPGCMPFAALAPWRIPGLTVIAPYEATMNEIDPT